MQNALGLHRYSRAGLLGFLPQPALMYKPDMNPLKIKHWPKGRYRFLIFSQIHGGPGHLRDSHR